MRAGQGRGFYISRGRSPKKIFKLRVDRDCADTQLPHVRFKMFSVVAIALITVVLALVAVDTNTHGRLAKVSNS